MDKWIKVEDRLPEKGGYVLCVQNKGNLPYMAMFHEDGRYFTIKLNDIVNPFHWMPLPEPPK